LFFVLSFLLWNSLWLVEKVLTLKVEIISLAHTNSGNDFIMKFYINICHRIGHIILNSFQLGSWLNGFWLS
jgi:hypothetical protein